MKRWTVGEMLSGGLRETLMKRRGILPEDADKFFRPRYERDIHGPFLFRDMERATTRVRDAIQKNERIIVFSDYDADGTCGAVVLSDFFRAARYENFDVYIPDRFREGYGLKTEHVEAFAAGGARLIVTIDCGVTSINEIARGNTLGIDTIVLDHHIVPPVWPDAYAILNPKRGGETYPFPGICGAGLAFKLVQGLVAAGDFKLPDGWEKWLLDAVAIATVADMVPLLDENRAFVFFGLTVLGKTRRRGLRLLSERAGLTLPFASDDIAFSIAPRINAASRLAHATLAYGLMTTSDHEEAERLAAHIEAINAERKTIVERIMAEIAPRISGERATDVLVIGDAAWPPGVLGIVANRLIEISPSTVFVWGGVGDTCRGSCRSANGVNVVELMRALPEGLLTEFGGHAAAGGFTFPAEALPRFTAAVCDAYARAVKSEDFKTLDCDAELRLADVNESTFAIIDAFSPFGVGNPKPLFFFADLTVAEAKPLGSNGGRHMQATFTDASGIRVRAVGFGLSPDIAAELRKGNHVDLVSPIERNTWNGKTEIRLRIVGVRSSVLSRAVDFMKQEAGTFIAV